MFKKFVDVMEIYYVILSTGWTFCWKQHNFLIFWFFFEENIFDFDYGLFRAILRFRSRSPMKKWSKSHKNWFSCRKKWFYRLRKPVHTKSNSFCFFSIISMITSYKNYVELSFCTSLNFSTKRSENFFSNSWFSVKSRDRK